MIGIGELLVVAVCVIVFIKPEDLPNFLKYIRKIYEQIAMIKRSIIDSIYENPTDLVRKCYDNDDLDIHIDDIDRTKINKSTIQPKSNEEIKFYENSVEED